MHLWTFAGESSAQIKPSQQVLTQVVYYKYSETVGGQLKKRNSPTEVIYQQPDGSGGYENCSQPCITKTSYDDLGRVIKTTDANNRVVEYEYDALGRQIRTVYKRDGGNPAIFSESFYTCCALNWSKDEEANYTFYAYDDMNRVTKVWTGIQDVSTPSGVYTPTSASLVEYEYDSFGNKSVVKTRSDSTHVRETTYVYDKNNRVVKIVYPYNAIPGDILWNEYFQYDTSGRLEAKLVGMVSGTAITAGSVTAYQYDDLGRLEKVKYNYESSSWPVANISIGAGDVTYGYESDASSLRTSMTDGSGTSEYSYDIQGRLVTYKPPVGLESGYHLEYGYNSSGQKTSVKITDGTNTTYNVSYQYYPNG